MQSLTFQSRQDLCTACRDWIRGRTNDSFIDILEAPSLLYDVERGINSEGCRLPYHPQRGTSYIYVPHFGLSAFIQKEGPTAARLSSGSLADFLARKICQIFYLKLLLDFLAVGFAYSVNNILSYPNITNLPTRRMVLARFVLKGCGQRRLGPDNVCYIVSPVCVHTNFYV